MLNTGVTGIFLARQVWMKFQLSFVQHFLQHMDAQTTLLQDILRDEGLGHVKNGSDWDLLGKAGLASGGDWPLRT